MTAIAACGSIILLSDVFLSLAFWIGLVQLKCPSCGGLAAVWVFGIVKWIALYIFASILTDGKSLVVLHRVVALLCLLSPVFESGRVLMAPPSMPFIGLCPDLGVLFLGTVCSLLACVVWEKGLWDDGKRKKTELNPRQLLLRVLQYFKPDYLYLIAAFTSLILAVYCETYIPLYQGKVIDMLRESTLQSSFYYTIGQLVLFSLGSALFSGSRGGMFKCALARLNKRLQHLLFNTLLKQEVHFFVTNKPGRLSSRLHSDVDRMGRTVALNANALVRSSVKFCLMLYVMMELSWELAVLTCIEMPLLAVLQKKYTDFSRELKDQIQECHAQNRDLASQIISKIHTVRSFRAEKEELRRYDTAVGELSAVNSRYRNYGSLYSLIRRMLSLGIKVLMLVEARTLISSGRLSIGGLVTFLLYQKPMLYNLREIMYSLGETASTVGVIDKVFSYLDRQPECKKAGELAPENLEGGIVFRDVTFTYPSASQGAPSLKSVSLTLQPGKMTALVGPSGSGKTSCVNLLKRLYEPQEGEILLDGKPLHHYEHKYFHQKVALVSQDPELFSGSLRYNIEYGLKDCSIEKVKEAAEMANADTFISELEDGYDTDVGERGSRLAGGERQTIAIVRALVRDPQVIILDEATSKLDINMQHAVLQEVLSCGRTVLIVAHQLKTVEKADHIIFMENGEVVEEGTHEELMARRGRYHRLKEELFTQTE